MNNKISLAKEVAWASQNMPRTLRQVAALPDLSGVRLACCMHLDMKMIPLVQGDPRQGRSGLLTTCNPTTVQDDVVARLVERGAEACAWRNMSDADWQQSWEKAIAPAAHSPVRDGRRYHHPAPPARRVWEHRGGSGSHRLGRQSAGGYSAEAIRSLTGTICRSKRGCTTAIWSVSLPGTPSSRPLTSPCMRKSAGDRLRPRSAEGVAAAAKALAVR